MRKVLSFICALILTALMPCAWIACKSLPADTGRYVAQKYDGWSGVLQAWIFCDWECGGSFVSWLNRCASQFEKAHEGVYIEFTPVSRGALEELGASGIRSPELVFFSPGVLKDASHLGITGSGELLRQELRMDERALPVAMGGCIFAVNRGMTDGIDPEAAIVPEGFERETAALLSGGTEPGEIELEDPGLDLGLPAFAQGSGMDTLLERFIDGGLPILPVSQREIAKLARLRDKGKGPDWELVPSGSYAYTSQLLLAGVTKGEGERYDLARSFTHMLLEEDCQQLLSDIGAFSTTGQTVHKAHSPYAPLDALLNSLPLGAAHPFSEHSE